MIRKSRQHTLTAFCTVAVALGFVLGAAAPAAAHNYVVSSTPEEGETLTTVPELFTVTANDILLDLSGEASGFGMVISDAAGGFYGDGCVTVDGRSMSTVAALGAAGDYTLTFQLVSADGHTLSDTIAFRYEPTAKPSTSPALTSAPVCATSHNGAGDGGGTVVTDPATTADSESAVVLTFVAFVLAAIAAVSAIVASAVITRNRRTERADESIDETTIDS
ncbi:copper resistance protein CopC [Microcella sp.]|uniref:copper resistance CopC family protein n=1 Tax=Microcella sp. TaxID=1913979 RepID=UPI00299F63A0|nr:copper resistance protein CopC [Microcella sp.]MDX2026618.1 copper resistance protein CopC [Microcella sp.]